MNAVGENKPNIWAIGMAMFSMFFGSGNIIFPVLIGQETGTMAFYAIVGLLFTAVLLPFLGLVSISLYNGDYVKFFGRLGKWPGWMVITLIMALIGPFAVIPRCIIISYAALKTFIPTVELIPFSLISCAVLYLLTFRKAQVLDILGKYLTPFLLIALVAIIVKGLGSTNEVVQTQFTPQRAFIFGLVEGYNTMDIFAAFMFSSVVLNSIKSMYPQVGMDQNKLLGVCFRAGIIGMAILAAIYMGMCFVAAYHGQGLEHVPKEQILATLAIRILGSSAGIVVCAAVSLACLTTAISLSLVFSEFVSHQLTKDRLSYKLTLFITMIISFVLSTLQFSGIQNFLVPILQITLPCLILLAVLNFLFKIYRVEVVRVPVFVVFIISLLIYMV